MNNKRWLTGVRSPNGVMHLHDIRKRNARTLCGAAAIGTSDGLHLWRWFTTFQTPSCTKCDRTARKRYGAG